LIACLETRTVSAQPVLKWRLKKLKRETGKRGTVKNAWSENAGPENTAPKCRTGKHEVDWKMRHQTAGLVNARKGVYGKPNGVLHV